MEALLIAAMQSELDALLEQDLLPVDKWEQLVTNEGYTYYRSNLKLDNKEEIGLIASTQPAQGPTAAISHASRMLKSDPDIAVMIGICAGRRQKEISMGDIIVADLAIRYDTDKRTTAGMEPQSVGYAQRPALVQWLNAYCSRSKNLKDLGLGKPPRSLRVQKDIILYKIADTTEPSSFSLTDAETLSETCPDWSRAVTQLEKDGLICITSTIELTAKGRSHVERTRLINGSRSVVFDSEPQIRVGTFATGSNVVSDESIWQEIAGRHERRVLAMDMEAAAFLEAIAGMQSAPIALVVKSVSDYAGPDKDDSFHVFCKRASAVFSLELIKSIVPMVISKGNSPEIAAIAERVRLLTDTEKKSLLRIGHGALGIEPATIQKLKSAGLLQGASPQVMPSALGRIAIAFASLVDSKSPQSDQTPKLHEATLPAPMPAVTRQDRTAWRDIIKWPLEIESVYESNTWGNKTGSGVWFYDFGGKTWLAEILVQNHAYQSIFMLAVIRIVDKQRAVNLLHSSNNISLGINRFDKYIFCGLLDVDMDRQSWSIFTKSRAIGDAGVFEKYQLKGLDAVLTERRELKLSDVNGDDPSPRTSPETWPVTYKAPEGN